MNNLERVRVLASPARRFVALVVSSGILCSLSGCAGTSEKAEVADRWASLPRTMGCVVEDAQLQDVPPALRVQQVTLRHEGAQRLVMSLQFLRSAPPDPEVVNGPYGPRNATGSIGTSILLVPAGSNDGRPYLVIDSTAAPAQIGWKAEVVAGDNHANALQSSLVSGNTRTLVVDFQGQAEVLGPGEMSADVHVLMSVDGTSPETATLFKAQNCEWGNPESPSSSTSRPSSPQPSLPSQSSSAPSGGAQAPSSASAPPCRGTTEQLCPAELSFFEDLRKLDLHPTRSTREFVDLGWGICGLLDQKGYDSVAEELYQQGHLNRQQIQALVGVSQARLCWLPK